MKNRKMIEDLEREVRNLEEIMCDIGASMSRFGVEPGDPEALEAALEAARAARKRLEAARLSGG